MGPRSLDRGNDPEGIMPDWHERKALREAWEREISASGLGVM